MDDPVIGLAPEITSKSIEDILQLIHEERWLSCYCILRFNVDDVKGLIYRTSFPNKIIAPGTRGAYSFVEGRVCTTFMNGTSFIMHPVPFTKYFSPDYKSKDHRLGIRIPSELLMRVELSIRNNRHADARIPIIMPDVSN